MYSGNRAKVLAKSVQEWVDISPGPDTSDADLAIETLNSFGMKRFVRQVLCLSGVVVVRKGKVRQVKFNPGLASPRS